jgi:hypothetical protein
MFTTFYTNYVTHDSELMYSYAFSQAQCFRTSVCHSRPAYRTDVAILRINLIVLVLVVSICLMTEMIMGKCVLQVAQ